jgi:hypothetical protein
MIKRLARNRIAACRIRGRHHTARVRADIAGSTVGGLDCERARLWSPAFRRKRAFPQTKSLLPRRALPRFSGPDPDGLRLFGHPGNGEEACDEAEAAFRRADRRGRLRPARRSRGSAMLQTRCHEMRKNTARYACREIPIVRCDLVQRHIVRRLRGGTASSTPPAGASLRAYRAETPRIHRRDGGGGDIAAVDAETGGQPAVRKTSRRHASGAPP